MKQCNMINALNLIKNRKLFLYVIKVGEKLNESYNIIKCNSWCFGFTWNYFHYAFKINK